MLVTLDCVGAHPTVITTLELPVFPPVSVDEAVMVWMPSTNTFEKLAPVCSTPCLLDDHVIARPASWSSATLPANVTEAPLAYFAPLRGCAIVTRGGRFEGVEPVPT